MVLAILAAMFAVLPSVSAYDHEQTYLANATYFVPEDIELPEYCDTTNVGIWVNTSVALGSGSTNFNYAFCCANVTDFVCNTTSFDGVTWPGSMCGADLSVPGKVKVGFATTNPAGLGPGAVHIGTLTIHCCNESDYCVADLTWITSGPDVSDLADKDDVPIEPVKWKDGTFRCIPHISGEDEEGDSDESSTTSTSKSSSRRPSPSPTATAIPTPSITVTPTPTPSPTPTPISTPTPAHVVTPTPSSPSEEKPGASLPGFELTIALMSTLMAVAYFILKRRRLLKK